MLGIAGQTRRQLRSVAVESVLDGGQSRRNFACRSARQHWVAAMAANAAWMLEQGSRSDMWSIARQITGKRRKAPTHVSVIKKANNNVLSTPSEIAGTWQSKFLEEFLLGPTVR